MRRDEKQIQEGSGTLTVYDSWGGCAEVFRQRRLFTVSTGKEEEQGGHSMFSGQLGPSLFFSLVVLSQDGLHDQLRETVNCMFCADVV